MDKPFINAEIKNLIDRMAHDFSRRGLVGEDKTITVDDLIQTGWEAVLIASKSYDENRGATFVTYAYPQVWRRMLAEIHKLGDSIPMPEYLLCYVIRQVSKAYEEFVQENEEEPTVDDLLDDKVLMNYLSSNRDTKGSDPDDLITEALSYMRGERTISLDADEDIDYEIEEESVEDLVDQQLLREAIDTLLDFLDDQEYDVLTMRLGFSGEDLTLREIAEETGLLFLHSLFLQPVG